MGKSELVALLSLSSWCLAITLWLFLKASRVFLQFVIVIFLEHTHLLFLAKIQMSICFRICLMNDVSLQNILIIL